MRSLCAVVIDIRFLTVICCSAAIVIDTNMVVAVVVQDKTPFQLADSAALHAHFMHAVAMDI